MSDFFPAYFGNRICYIQISPKNILPVVIGSWIGIPLAALRLANCDTLYYISMTLLTNHNQLSKGDESRAYARGVWNRLPAHVVNVDSVNVDIQAM